MRYYEAMITVILLLFVELLTLCTANDVSPGVIKFTRLYVDHEGLTRLRHCTYCLILRNKLDPIRGINVRLLNLSLP